MFVIICEPIKCIFTLFKDNTCHYGILATYHISVPILRHTYILQFRLISVFEGLVTKLTRLSSLICAWKAICLCSQSAQTKLRQVDRETLTYFLMLNK